MTDYDFDSSGLVFTEAARDVDAEVRAESLVRGKIAAAAFWPYLAEAASETEFGHRLALVEDRLAQQVPADVLEPVQASLAADWKLLHTARQQERQAATRGRGAQIRTATAHARSEQLSPDQEFFDQRSSKWVTAANSASGYTLPARYQLPEDIRGNQHATEGYRDARYHAANGYDWRLADGDSFTLQHQDYQQGYSRAHDDLKAGSRHGKHAYIDPSDAQRYSAYPDLNPPVDNGPLQGPDGFVTDPQPDNTGASNAVIQQRQLTPGQWTVTPGTEWPVRPNAGDPSQVPRTASGPYTHNSEVFPASGSPRPLSWVKYNDVGGVDHSISNEQMMRGIANPQNGWKYELDTSNPLNEVVHATGPEGTYHRYDAYPTKRVRVGSHQRQAGEGIVPTPGPNPNYFSQGSDGLAGPPSFPENPSGQIEPKTDNRMDDLYGAVPPQVSPGSAMGQADGQGYSRQAPGSSATAGRRPFSDSSLHRGGESSRATVAALDRTAVGNVDSDGWLTAPRAGYPKAEADCGHKFWDRSARCHECGFSVFDERNHEDWVRDTFGDKGAEHADALLRDNHIGPTHYSSRTAAGELRCGECGAHLTRGEEGGGAFGPAWNDELGKPNAGEPGVRESGWHWHHPAENRPPISNPSVHTFGSTGEAYDSSQTEDHIKDGDVLSVPSEGVHGYLYQAWPIAVVHPGNPGAFHTFTHGSHEPAAYEDQGRYGASVAKAREVAAQHGHTASHHKLAGGFGGTEPTFQPGDRVMSFRGEGATVHQVIPSHDPGKSHRVQVRWDDPRRNLTWDGKQHPEGAGDLQAYYENVFSHHPDTLAGIGRQVDQAVPRSQDIQRAYSSRRAIVGERLPKRSLEELHQAYNTDQIKEIVSGHDTHGLRPAEIGILAAAHPEWDSLETKRSLGATDGRIVGHCDHCRNPLRYHTNENGTDELRHLHNNDNRCSNGQRAQASLSRVHAFFDPADPSVIVVTAEDVSRTRPTLDNPSGAGDEFTANTWDNALRQRPLQSAEDRHINSPTQARDPIRVIDSSPRDNDLDEDRNQNSMARETSLHEIMEMN